MSLRLDVKVIFNLRARIMCSAQDSTQSHIFERTFGVDTHGQLGKIANPVPESTYRIDIGLEISFIPICVTSYCCTDSSRDILTYSRFPTKQMVVTSLRRSVTATSELTFTLTSAGCHLRANICCLTLSHVQCLTLVRSKKRTIVWYSCKWLMSGLSNTKHLCGNVQSCIRTSSPMLR